MSNITYDICRSCLFYACYIHDLCYLLSMSFLRMLNTWPMLSVGHVSFTHVTYMTYAICRSCLFYACYIHDLWYLLSMSLLRMLHTWLMIRSCLLYACYIHGLCYLLVMSLLRMLHTWPMIYVGHVSFTHVTYMTFITMCVHSIVYTVLFEALILVIYCLEYIHIYN